MSGWWPARRGVAALAILAAALTGAFGMGLGGSGWLTFGTGVYLLISAVALFIPAAISVQVVGGLALLGGLLLAENGSTPLLLIPAVAGVIFTAELLTVVARMDTPFDGDSRDDLPRAGFSALIGGGVFGAVVLVSGLPGPTGFGAVVLASGACVVLATVLVRGVDWLDPGT